MPTLMVYFESEGHRVGAVRAILDSGAQPNLINQEIARKLYINTKSTAKRVMGINGKPFSVRQRAIVRIFPWFQSDTSIEDEVWVMPKDFNWSIITPPTSLNSIKELDGLSLADPYYWESKKTAVLLGVKFFAKVTIQIIKREISGIVLMDTDFGVVIFGAYPANLDSETGKMHAACECIDYRDLDLLVQRFWEIDQIAHCEKLTPEEEQVEQNFLATMNRDESGRFVVTIPLKPDVKGIGSSREIALRRFMFLEQKLQKDAVLREKYVEFMREYERLGHMRIVTERAKPGEIVYHIPHHCVTKKFRVVFDASCKTDKGISLNEIQQLGGKLQRDLFEIVMRFRKHRIAFSADIKMMFRQIRIAPSQWNLQRIFWRENPNQCLREYWLTVVTYGMTSSPYNAVRTIIECGRAAAQDFPEVANVIANDFYMDDCVSGAEDEATAYGLATDLCNILKTGGFELCKWKSNSRQFLDRLRSDGEAKMVFENDEKTSVLGLQWLVDKDQFTFVVRQLETASKVTKRFILSSVAQLYDPNGYIAPVTITGKILIQDVWRLSLDWDQEVPPEILERWKVFWETIKYLEKFTIDRWIGTNRVVSVQIHGFSDASTMAYGAVIYARVERADGNVTSNLIVAKTRVAPLKTITVPRLELAAAELLGRLLEEVRGSMEWTATDYVLWTDSLVVLYWLRRLPRSLKTYVANRVSSIQTHTAVNKWRHVGTADNPADLLSRGVAPADLVDNRLWLSGPRFLTLPVSEWPANPIEKEISDEAPGETRVYTIMKVNEGLSIWLKTERTRVPLVMYASCLERAVGIIARLFQFLNAMREKVSRKRAKRRKLVTALPTAAERALAMNYLIRKAQEDSYIKEVTALSHKEQLHEKSRIISLRPILDQEGLIRVGGRLDNAEGEFEMRHPPIIPSESRLAWLVIDQAHRATRHGSVQIMTHYIRQRYWVPRLRSNLRSFLHKCVICARYNYRLEQQLMADLPKDRVRVGKPFLHAGVDYAGPVEVKVIDRKGCSVARRKSWIAIFVCLKTRAVHIDLVTDLTSVAFLACYERFIGRRGRCERMYSDNGTAFVGAAKELRRAFQEWKVKGVFASLSLKGTDWRFMTPAAPHQGGIYEAAVKSMKYHLTRVIGQKVLTHEQLTTLLVEIEGILNSRPIHPLSDDPDDIQALTPGHFLVGEPIVLPPPFAISEQSTTHGVRLWRERQTMLNHFWKRWLDEYLATLQERKKWRREKENVKLGQLVLIKSENFPPAQWALGRISELIPSKDGFIRSVVIRTQTGQLRRPVQKICIIPIDSSGPSPNPMDNPGRD